MSGFQDKRLVRYSQIASTGNPKQSRASRYSNGQYGTMGSPCLANHVVHGCNAAIEQLFWAHWAGQTMAIELPLNFWTRLVCNTEAAPVAVGGHLTRSRTAVCGDSSWLIPP
jgi:hypothetical protein